MTIFKSATGTFFMGTMNCDRSCEEFRSVQLFVDVYIEMHVVQFGKNLKVFSHCLMGDVHKVVCVTHKVVWHILFQKIGNANL